MKEYEKEYEDVFSSSRVLKKCKLYNVSTNNDLDLGEYMNLFRRTLRKYEREEFDHYVKITWLMRQFCYNGKQRRRFRANGHILDGAFAIFMKRDIGFDLFITKNTVFSRLVTYFDDFFPDFDLGDPFKTKYEYPYKHVRLEYLMTVYEMPERLELLDHAEKKKLSYLKFQDYILNYIHCVNQDVDEQRFTFSISSHWVSYIKYKYYEG